VLTVAHRCRPARGERVCGDVAVARHEGGVALVAVVDALGHGPQAAETAELARAFLDSVPLSRSAAEIVLGLHGALRGSRGAAAAVCVSRGEVLECCVVGNVSVRALAARPVVVPNAGVAGYRVPSRLHASSFRMPAGARLVLSSDGVSPQLDLAGSAHLAPDAACEWILERFALSRDDARILIAHAAWEATT
jgi:negative regulator of sigma-B (phosphoserine phosphatase)